MFFTFFVMKIFFSKLISFLAGSDEYISGSTKSNLESVVENACAILVIAVVETFVVKVVVDIVVEVVVEVVVDELDNGTDRTSAAAAVVVGMVVVVGSSSEQTVFSAAFHLQASSSNHEKKSLKYQHNIRYVAYHNGYRDGKFRIENLPNDTRADICLSVVK